MTKLLRSLIVPSALIFAFTTIGLAQTEPSKEFPGISIKNFGKMDDRFYRGARPKEGKGQFAALKALGVQTVIDLTDKPRAYEKLEAEAAGLKYVSIPMSDGDYPEPATIDLLTNTMNDPATGVFFAHCAGGRHRTGLAGAIWRYTKYGWDYDQVYKEMKNYDFYSRWGHGDIKDFVRDYGNLIARQKELNAPTTAAGTTN